MQVKMGWWALFQNLCFFIIKLMPGPQIRKLSFTDLKYFFEEIFICRFLNNNHADGIRLRVSKMFSKGKQRHPLSVCADCGASDPSWASVNRGVLICSDCCSVHRSLGRHISHVKCLKHGYWIPEQLTMVQSLYSCGANRCDNIVYTVTI